MRESPAARSPSGVFASGSSPVRRANAGWVASMPESSTAQQSVRHDRLNRRVAASALTVTRERQTAGRARAVAVDGPQRRRLARVALSPASRSAAVATISS